MSRITIIPDVHGRTFWWNAVTDVNDVPVVFLGDYLDPYPEERIDPAQAFADFMDIIDLKKKHPDMVTLLLGNHDLHYLLTRIGGGRTDVSRFEKIRETIRENLDIFDMALELEADEHRYLFTHAGVLKGWLERNDYLHYGDAPGSAGAAMNWMLHDRTWRDTLLWALCDTGYRRGGWDPWGSPVWADVDEHDPGKAEVDGVYQIFGHTWSKHEIITANWACLDCGEAFSLNLETNTITRKK